MRNSSTLDMSQPLEDFIVLAGTIKLPLFEDPTAEVIFRNGSIQTWTFSRCCGSIGAQDIIIWLNNKYEMNFMLSQTIYHRGDPIYTFFVDK
jgi:hypothetical protein